MELLATFFTYYGAMRFNKYCRKEKIPAKMAPVPRKLSASCGVCVRFEAELAPVIEEHEDMELCYTVSPGNEYTPLPGRGEFA